MAIRGGFGGAGGGAPLTLAAVDAVLGWSAFIQLPGETLDADADHWIVLDPVARQASFWGVRDAGALDHELVAYANGAGYGYGQINYWLHSGAEEKVLMSIGADGTWGGGSVADRKFYVFDAVTQLELMQILGASGRTLIGSGVVDDAVNLLQVNGGVRSAGAMDATAYKVGGVAGFTGTLNGTVYVGGIATGAA